MKTAILLLCAALATSRAAAQHLQIRQSMETAELREEPAQFVLTLPGDKDPSWVFDAGVAYRFNQSPAGSATRLISKLVAEYHRKTETDKEQNNFEAGYGYLLRLNNAAPAHMTYFLEGDLKYVYDGEAISHSAALDAFVTPYRAGAAGAKKMHWNTPVFFGHFSTFLSPHAGVQAQYVADHHGEEAAGTDFVVRPMFDVQTVLRYNRTTAVTAPNPDVDRLFELALKYVGRYAAVNTAETGEAYTDQFAAALRYFPFAAVRTKVSLGVSYNTGTDPLKGLAEQSYWLFSFNLSL